MDHFANHSNQISETLSRFDFVDYNTLVEGGGARGHDALVTYLFEDLRSARRWTHRGLLLGGSGRLLGLRTGYLLPAGAALSQGGGWAGGPAG